MTPPATHPRPRPRSPSFRASAARGAANAFGWLGMIVGLRKPSSMRWWQRRVREMGDCRSPADLVAKFGEPQFKMPQAGFEIWHYPLGVERGMNYSVHVAVWPDGQRQTYLYFEPVPSRAKKE